MFAELHQRLDHEAALPPVNLFSVRLIQTICLQKVTHSSAQRETSIPFSFNHFRTLFIATGVYPHSSHSGNPSFNHSDLTSFFSCTYEMQISQPPYFDGLPSNGGCGGCILLTNLCSAQCLGASVANPHPRHAATPCFRHVLSAPPFASHRRSARIRVETP